VTRVGVWPYVERETQYSQFPGACMHAVPIHIRCYACEKEIAEAIATLDAVTTEDAA